MPPKTKRKLQLEAARDAKRRKSEDGCTTNPSSSHPPDDPESCSESDDPSFDPDRSLDSDEKKALAQTYIEEWVCALSRDDLMSLSITLHHALVDICGVKKTEAAEVIGHLINKSERTVREWKTTFYANDGSFPDSEQGCYQRTGVLWRDEELNEAARDYVHQNAVVKGRPNMTSASFCRWVNDTLLPNSILEPGFPRHIGVDTARRWLHELGFEVLDKKKGVYIDGHERQDVIEHRRKFLRKLVAGGFLTKEDAPTEEAKSAFPTDIESPAAERRAKNIFIFHDESTFNANDDESLQWGTAESQLIRPMSKGSGIMVSDFITERDGYLRLTEDEYKEAKVKNPTIRMSARQLLEYGESREGYWTSEKFMKQMEKAVEVAEAKYPNEKGYRLFWVFDQSSCHTAFNDDALNANKMNARPGGQQPIMRDTIWNGKSQSLKKRVIIQGKQQWIPRGLIDILTERGCYRKGMKVDDMRKEIATHPDFSSEKTKVEHYVNSRGHAFLFIPKYHCELNPIERCWSQAKRYTRAYCNYCITGLRRNIPAGLDRVTTENIQNYFRRVRDYMYGYLLGHQAGLKLEELVKKFSKKFKSHRRVAESD